MLYTAKGSGALLVPIAAAIAKSNGWDTVFMIAMSFNLVAAVLALVALKPLRARHFAIGKATVAPPAAPSTVGDHHHRTT
jgi:OFA family oxalate/formate antiporter-like MFS transporter